MFSDWRGKGGPGAGFSAETSAAGLGTLPPAGREGSVHLPQPVHSGGSNQAAYHCRKESHRPVMLGLPSLTHQPTSRALTTLAYTNAKNKHQISGGFWCGMGLARYLPTLQIQTYPLYVLFFFFFVGGVCITPLQRLGL